MSNKREILRDNITKLIDGKSLDEVIESLQELRNHNYGCEVIRLKHSINMQPIVCLYDVVNEIPSNAIIGKKPELKEDVKTELKVYKDPILTADNLPRNFFMDTSYFKEVYNMTLDAESEIAFITRIKKHLKNSRDRIFVKYGEGNADAVLDGIVAGFTIINLDSITSDKIDISVFNPYYTRYLIGKQGIKARELAAEINKELGYERVKKIFFKEIK